MCTVGREKYLYHGTTPQTLGKIAKSGLCPPSLCGLIEPRWQRSKRFCEIYFTRNIDSAQLFSGTVPRKAAVLRIDTKDDFLADCHVRPTRGGYVTVSACGCIPPERLEFREPRSGRGRAVESIRKRN